METLAKGTIEPLVLRVTDTLNNLTSISSATFDVYTNDDAETAIIEGESAIVDGMLVLPLIDTTIAEFEEGEYKLFITFPASPGTIRLGPFYFRVDD